MSIYSPRLPIILSARRRDLGISQAELAARCAMTLDTVERMEQGRFLPSPAQSWQLALALDLDPLGVSRWATAELLLHAEFLREHVLPPTELSFHS